MLALPAQTTEWDRAYGDPRYACGPQTAAIDMSGDRWVLCDGATVSLLSDLLHPKYGKVQYREGVALTRFDAHGEPSPAKTITSKNQSLQASIAAKQGTVAAGPAGTCALLASDTNRAVTLSAYNASNQPKWKTATPLTAPSGRTYSLYALPNGYLATDEKLIAKCTHTGNTVYLLYGLAGDSAFHVVKLSTP